ncbi:hypothetical protein QCA50_014211 [Cerrena zonata]|uniref:Flavin reductase like domain-containing protein n=1 Tax=Cerrena zonata TaxID=2478898 RepID=A0AAW0FZU8_9APHY
MASELPPFTLSAFKLSQSPNPSFKSGQKVDAIPEGKKWLDGEKDGWKVIEADTEDPRKLFALMISGSLHGQLLGREPWPLQIHTALNIRTTKEFTANIISTPWVNNANSCDIDAPNDVTEWPLSGLTKAPSLHVEPPRVNESASSVDCELFQDIHIKHPDTGASTQAFILGLVKAIHVRNDMLTERGTLDPDKFQPVGKLREILYGTLGKVYRIVRPAWSEEKKAVI